MEDILKIFIDLSYKNFMLKFVGGKNKYSRISLSSSWFEFYFYKIARLKKKGGGGEIEENFDRIRKIKGD